jgi:hypothetical protein
MANDTIIAASFNPALQRKRGSGCNCLTDWLQIQEKPSIGFICGFPFSHQVATPVACGGLGDVETVHEWKTLRLNAWQMPGNLSRSFRFGRSLGLGGLSKQRSADEEGEEDGCFMVRSSGFSP